MRRLDPTSLPRFLANGEPPPREARQQPGLWSASFVLRSITPILGGGIQSFEPDQVDLVRPPAIRGQLRWWWRALFQEWGEHPDPDALFTQEARLWGGVGVPGETESPGLRSRVRIAVEVLDRERSKVVPAGFHPLRDDGHLRALPDWGTDEEKIGWKLGYALFPLQKSKDDRDYFELREPGRPMPTCSVRTRVRFRLRVTVAGPKPGISPSSTDIQQVLASVWAWVHFGGLGARTRRGFGALEIAEPVHLDTIPETDIQAWRHLFLGPRAPEDIKSWLQELERVAATQGRAWPCQILVGSRKSDASAAHEEIVDLLKAFRQATEIGRDPGKPRPGQRKPPPSQSRWPEPHLLRVLAPPGPPFVRHPPPQGLATQVENGEVGAPRAAFGLPIQVQFKDGNDQRANATFLPLGSQRWPSPLLVRPLRMADGEYHSVAVFLPIPPPEEVRVEYKDAKKTTKSCPVARSTGARSTIAKVLVPTEGKALDAFAEWLVRERGYSRA